MNLESLLNNFLTSGIEFADPTTFRKVKVLNIFQLAVVLLAPLLGLFYFYIGAVSLFYVTTLAGLLMISSIILLRKTKNLKIAGNYSIFIVWVTLLILAWNTGAITYEGVIKPTWILNTGFILLAIYLNGYAGGTIWTTIVFIETGIIIYLYRIGYQFPNFIPVEISAVYYLGAFSICLLIILLFAFLFEKQTSEALIREQEKSKALRESKRYIDYIFDRYPIPTFIIDKNHRVIQWNQACLEMTGVSPEEILGKEVWEGFTVDDRGSLADLILMYPDSIEEKYGESIIHRTDSGWYELEMTLPKLKGEMRAVITSAPILDNNGEIRGAIQTIQEIKERSLGQAEDSFVNPTFKIDPQGKITFWNKACEEDFGYTASQMIGKSALAFVSKQYRPTFREAVAEVFNGESELKKELKYYNKKGKAVYVIARTYPLQVADGGDKECVIVNTNITQLRLKLKKVELYALETKEKLKILSDEHELLKKNIATFIRKKPEQETS